jgi:hypothetical protein
MVMIVAYDLHNPGRDYEDVTAVLKKADAWAHPEGSVWFLDDAREPDWWRDQLRDAGDVNDEYFVARMHQYWAAFRVGDEVADWLKSPNRTW